MVCIPKQDSHNLYQWLDFFEILEDSIFDLSKPHGSYRIDAVNQRLETRGWHGPETQTFLDYIAQKIDIDPTELPSFKTKHRQAEDGRFYANVGKVDSKNVRFSFSGLESTALIAGGEIELRPKYDRERRYSWVEGYVKDEGGNDILVGVSKFIRGEAGLYEWKGPEVQAVIDWINGDLPIEKTLPIRVSLDNKSLLLCLKATQESKIMVQFASNKRLSQYDVLQLVPNNDGIREWLDIYKIDKKSGKPAFLISQALITRENKSKLQGDWIGQDKQRERDRIEESPTSQDEVNEYFKKLLGEFDAIG